MVAQAGTRIQASFDIAQAFAVGQLGETERQEVIIGREPARFAFEGMTLDTSVEGLRMQQRHHLGKDRTEMWHAFSLASSISLTCLQRHNSLLLAYIHQSPQPLTGQ